MNDTQIVVEQEVTTLAQRARLAVVTTDVEYQDVSVSLRGLKTVRAKVSELFDPQVSKAHDAWKASIALRKKFTDPLDYAENCYKLAMGKYTQEKERIAREEQARLQRIEDERARKEREKLLARAEQVKTEKKADELRQRASEVVAPIVRVEVEKPKAQGVSERSVWKANVVDAASVPDRFKVVDVSTLNALGRGGRKPDDVPGVVWVEEKILSAQRG